MLNEARTHERTLRAMSLSKSFIAKVPSLTRSLFILTHSRGTLDAWPILSQFSLFSKDDEDSRTKWYKIEAGCRDVGGIHRGSDRTYVSILHYIQEFDGIGRTQKRRP